MEQQEPRYDPETGVEIPPDQQPDEQQPVTPDTPDEGERHDDGEDDDGDTRAHDPQGGVAERDDD